MNTEKQCSLSDPTELLQRILNAVEAAKRKPWFEPAFDIVPALAITASAPCAYQSKLWDAMPVCHE